MAADDGDVLICWVGALMLRDKAAGADDVEGCYAKEPLWVVDALCLENFGGDWDCAVDGVGDDEDVGFGCALCNALC